MHDDHGVSNCMLVHCRHLASQDKHKVKADDDRTAARSSARSARRRKPVTRKPNALIWQPKLVPSELAKQLGEHPGLKIDE